MILGRRMAMMPDIRGVENNWHKDFLSRFQILYKVEPKITKYI